MSDRVPHEPVRPYLLSQAPDFHLVGAQLRFYRQ
jgi:hypothetical protein